MCETGECRRYRWTPELEELLRAAYDAPKKDLLSARLDVLARKTQWPRAALTAHAGSIGLRYFRLRRWTAEEDAYLREMAGAMSVATMARALRRSEEAVKLRCFSLRVSRKRDEGYNIGDLAACFGVPPNKVSRWMDRGLLGKVHERGAAGGGRRVVETNVMRFIRAHYREYDLRRVDQLWFTAMVFGGANGRD